MYASNGGVMVGFKSDDKIAEYSKKLTKQSFLLRAEIEYLDGERIFKHATEEEEELNMDEVYDALDSFSNASKLAYEYEDVEMEARCEAWIGKINNQAFKKESKAVSNFTNVVRLANCLKPRDVTGEPWFV